MFAGDQRSGRIAVDTSSFLHHPTPPSNTTPYPTCISPFYPTFSSPHYPTLSYHPPSHPFISSQEIKEAVELPLTHPELYEEIGIRPPKGRSEQIYTLEYIKHSNAYPLPLIHPSIRPPKGSTDIYNRILLSNIRREYCSLIHILTL